MDTLPPDPYKALGVPKDAELPQIRSAHRKLVLKCHPDKVQDPTQKAAKQDEFQAVQQAYELLIDDKKRTGYDEKVKLFELRKEMGRGNPTPRSNPFEYEVRNAEPRTTSTTYTTRVPPKVYSHPPPRSYEDLYEEPLRSTPRKSTSYESTDRKRNSTREEERERARRYEEDERLRAKLERDAKKSGHSERKKRSDKEKRKGAEEKVRTRTTTAYAEDDSEDDYRGPTTRASGKKTERQKMEEDARQREEIRQREEFARNQEAARAMQEAIRAQRASRERERERPERPTIKTAPLDPKWNEHMDFAGQYMQAARQKVRADPDFHPGMPRRAETFTAPTYNIRYATPPTQQYSDDDTPRRSSARKETRRASEAPVARTREKSNKGSKRSPIPHPNDPYIVEPPSPPPMKKPSLQTHSSAPPIIPQTFSRKEPSRSKTSDYPRNDKVPPLPRAATFTSSGGRGRDRGGSRLKEQVYTSSDSDSDSPIYPSPRNSHSPPPRRAPEQTRYIIDNGRSVPIKSRDHREQLRHADNDPYARDRSESPLGGAQRHSTERPPVTRQSSDRSRAVPTRSQPQNYYPPDPPEAPPIVLTARPKMPPRETSYRSSPRSSGNGPRFEEVKYAPTYGQEHVVYSAHPPASGTAEAWRRGSDPSHHREYSYPSRSGREPVYA